MIYLVGSELLAISCVRLKIPVFDSLRHCNHHDRQWDEYSRWARFAPGVAAHNRNTLLPPLFSHWKAYYSNWLFVSDGNSCMDFDALDRSIDPLVCRGQLFSASPVFSPEFVEVENGYTVANIYQSLVIHNCTCNKYNLV